MMAEWRAVTTQTIPHRNSAPGGILRRAAVAVAACQGVPWDADPTHRVRPGTALIASTDLIEPTFARTVIYVIEHNEAGSLGVILNRMSQTAVHNLLPPSGRTSRRPPARALRRRSGQAGRGTVPGAS